MPRTDGVVRLLDLFCGAGGAAMGYHRAGFDEIVGVDINPQPRFPFTFVQGDALEYLAAHGTEFDAIHASPPCQHYTTMNNRWGSTSPPLISTVLNQLGRLSMPWVIENVEGAKSHLPNSVTLTGEMFGLRVYRPRLFASSIFLLLPDKPPRQRDVVAVYGRQDGRRLWTRRDGSELRVASLEAACVGMGIDWMTWDEIREAIPPVYTEFVGRQLLMAHEHAHG